MLNCWIRLSELIWRHWVMANECKEYRLGDIATFVYGKMPQKHLLGFGKYITYSGYKYLEPYPEMNAASGDLIVVARGVGGTGDVKLVVRDCYLTNLSIKITLDNKYLLNDYFYYMFKENNLRYLDSGSAQSQITIADLSNINLKVPCTDYQYLVVRHLKKLDAKISLNNKIIQTLEKIALTLFKSWFIDFDPVVDNALDAAFFEQNLEFSDELLRQAKARKIAREEGTTKELPDSICQLFPAAFTDCAESSSGLGGWVPEGWENVAIYSLADFVNGAAYKAFQPNLEQRGLPIIKIAELKAGVSANTAFSDRNMPEKYRLTTGDILFSWSGNPDTSIDTFVWAYGEAWLNQHIFKITPPSKPGERSFVLMALKYLKPIFSEIARNKQTTGLGHVTIADLKRLQIVKPEPRILAAWDSVVSPYVNQAFTLTQQSLTLAKLRDTLLPKLISGELRIDEIEEHFAEGDLVKPC